MKIMFSAGEASGDMHAAAVAAEIRRICPDADMFGMGGSGMARAGVRIIYDIQNLGIIGVVEVIRHLPLFSGSGRCSGKPCSGRSRMCWSAWIIRAST